MSLVRVRFAPSPTGFFHIGSARTALFNWLYAKHTNGKFILRIEDTDQVRNTDESLHSLLTGIRWLGIDWDEGPEKGGDYRSYFQSKRNEIYHHYLEILKEKEKVYQKDGAWFFRLEGERSLEYDPHKKKEIEKVHAQSQTINDLIRGTVERAEDRDFVIWRSQGGPSFHFVSVVDDLTMKITDVIRGEDHLSNTSKHLELYKALGATPPRFAHIPLILKEQGSGKMSKREKGALIEDYQKRNFIPEAVRNYLCLLGWSPKDNQEILSIDTIISQFELKDINQNNARFDEKKLAFINAEYLRNLPAKDFKKTAQKILQKNRLTKAEKDNDYLDSVLAISQEKISSFEQLPDYLDYFFNDDYPYQENSRKRIFKKGNPLERLQEAQESLEKIGIFDEENIENTLQNLSDSKQKKIVEYMPIIRFAVSGIHSGPGFYPTLKVLGKDRVLHRIDRFLKHKSSPETSYKAQ